MVMKLRAEGYPVGRYKTRKIMAKLALKVTQRVAYKVTTKRKHSDAVADNLVNMNFNCNAPNKVWAGDVTYLKTGEGWMYLAIVMDLYSRRIVGWHISERMTIDLVANALTRAFWMRKPGKGLILVMIQINNNQPQGSSLELVFPIHGRMRLCVKDPKISSVQSGR